MILQIITVLLVVIIIVLYIYRDNFSITDVKGVKETINNNYSNSKTKDDIQAANKDTHYDNIPASTPDEIAESSLSKGVAIAKDIFTDPNLYATIVIDIALRAIIKKAIVKFTGKQLAELSIKGTIKTTASILKSIGADAVKLGTKAAEKISEKVLEKTLVKAGEKSGEAVAAKVAQKTAIAASTGPGFPFVEAGFLAFDVLSIGLDLGDAGGYGKMATNEMYIDIKQGIDKQIQEEYTKAGATWPSIIGPLDQLEESEYTKRLQVEVAKIMDPSKNPVDPLVSPMIIKLAKDLKDGVITKEQVEDDNVMKRYTDLLNMDDIIAKANVMVCTNSKGKIASNGQCTYKDKTSCESTYTWPIKSDETYAEYKEADGICVSASGILRGLCEEAGVGYDTNTGRCKIDENYCKKKGADWGYNEKIKENDCYTNTGQDIAELLFGTTIVRGLKQIFDPAQYEKCKSDESDDGAYGCIKCPEGSEGNGQLCYPKCKIGYHPFGCCVCTPDCPQGYVDDGATCRKVSCNDNEEHNGALCYPKCKEGYGGAGPVCWEKCKPGYVDDGAFCRNPLDTYGRGAGRVPDVTCDSGFSQKGVGAASWCDNGPRGDFWNLQTQASKVSCNADEEINGGLCYPKCKDGYTADGCCICRKGGDVYAKGTYGRGVGTPDTEIIGKGTSYGRGAGVVANEYRIKKRAVDYSTKSN